MEGYFKKIEKETKIPCDTEKCTGSIEGKPTYGTTLYWCTLCKKLFDAGEVNKIIKDKKEELEKEKLEKEKLEELNSNNPSRDRDKYIRGW